MDTPESSPSFMKALFSGHIPETRVFPYPEPKAEEKEVLKLILDNLHKFAKDHLNSEAIDREAKISASTMGALKEMGLFGLIVPDSYGGVGLSQMGYSRVCEELGAIDSSIAVTLGAHQSIGLKALLQFGTEEQKARYLPKLASGEMIAAFALTEPGSGSDAYSIKTRAERQADGSFVINGNKLWITNGAMADFFTIFAKTEGASSDGKKKAQITAFIVENWGRVSRSPWRRSTPGVWGWPRGVSGPPSS
jgi:acyl-CoA dehydrogenase family protein 9